METIAQNGVPSRDGDDGLTLGPILRQARLENGADLASVAAAIRVPQHYLCAIEDEHFDALPGKAYAIGFIRCYAKFLGLPQQDMIDRYKAQANPCGPVHNVYWHEPVQESRLPQRAMVLSGLIAALGAYSIWFSVSGTDAGLPANPVVPDMVLARAADASVADMKPLPERAQAVADETPAPAAADATPIPARVDVASLEQTVSSLAPKVIEGRRPLPLIAAEAADGRQMVTVHVVEEAWLHVTQGDKILFSGVLPAGRDYRPPSGEGVLLTTGNAGGVILRMGDWSSGPLGKSGLVRRDIPLDAAIWRSRVAQAESF